MAEGRLPKIALKWMPKQKRARGRPKKYWMEDIRKDMNEINLHGGQWEDRKQWSLGVGQRRKTFWNRCVCVCVYVCVCVCVCACVCKQNRDIEICRLSYGPMGQRMNYLNRRSRSWELKKKSGESHALSCLFSHKRWDLWVFVIRLPGLSFMNGVHCVDVGDTHVYIRFLWRR